MTGKKISNGKGFFWIIAVFLGQGVVASSILIILGITQTIEPLLLTSFNHGLVIEGTIILAGALTSSALITLFIKHPMEFVITDEHIQAMLPGSLISKSSSYVERHPLEGITSIELEEVVSRDDEGGKSITYSAKLIGFYGTNIGTLRGITSTGVADEIADAIGVGIVRKFD